MRKDARLSKRELRYQAERAASLQAVEPTPSYVIDRYRSQRWSRLFAKDFFFKQLGDVAGRRVLDFGAGEGILTVQLALLGADVTALDISPELIEVAKRRAELDGVEERIDFRVGMLDDFPGLRGAFDLVACKSVLHHLDIPVHLPAILRCLKPGGRILILEPIALSPTVRVLRRLVPIPIDASPEERQLARDDLRYIVSHLDTHQSSLRYFNLFGRLARLFPNRDSIDRGHPLTRYALLGLAWLDQVLLKAVPSFREYCGTVVIAGGADDHSSTPSGSP